MTASRAAAPSARRAAVSIAGLDPSGGAGLAADLRAFHAAGAWGGAVCAALTVQSTRGVAAVKAVPSSFVVAQAEALFGDLTVGCVKTGALGSAANVRAVAALARVHARIPFVVDPVRIATRGAAPQLDGGAPARALLDLARAALLVTPNLDEAAALLGASRVTAREARDAAVALIDAGCAAVLVKGGHARGAESVDWLATRRGITRFASPRRAGRPVHGTGCTLAALIAGRVAASRSREPDLVGAVRWSRARLDAALAAPLRVGHGLAAIDVLA